MPSSGKILIKRFDSPILEDDLLTTDEDCDLDEEDVDDDDEVVPPDPDEAGLALKALK